MSEDAKAEEVSKDVGTGVMNVAEMQRGAEEDALIRSAAACLVEQISVDPSHSSVLANLSPTCRTSMGGIIKGGNPPTLTAETDSGFKKVYPLPSPLWQRLQNEGVAMGRVLTAQQMGGKAPSVSSAENSPHNQSTASNARESVDKDKDYEGSDKSSDSEDEEFLGTTPSRNADLSVSDIVDSTFPTFSPEDKKTLTVATAAVDYALVTGKMAVPPLAPNSQAAACALARFPSGPLPPKPPTPPPHMRLLFGHHSVGTVAAAYSSASNVDSFSPISLPTSAPDNLPTIAPLTTQHKVIQPFAFVYPPPTQVTCTEYHYAAVTSVTSSSAPMPPTAVTVVTAAQLAQRPIAALGYPPARFEVKDKVQLKDCCFWFGIIIKEARFDETACQWLYQVKFDSIRGYDNEFQPEGMLRPAIIQSSTPSLPRTGKHSFQKLRKLIPKPNRAFAYWVTFGPEGKCLGILVENDPFSLSMSAVVGEKLVKFHYEQLENYGPKSEYEALKDGFEVDSSPDNSFVDVIGGVSPALKALLSADSDDGTASDGKPPSKKKKAEQAPTVAATRKRRHLDSKTEGKASGKLDGKAEGKSEGKSQVADSKKDKKKAKAEAERQAHMKITKEKAANSARSPQIAATGSLISKLAKTPPRAPFIPKDRQILPLSPRSPAVALTQPVEVPSIPPTTLASCQPPVSLPNQQQAQVLGQQQQQAQVLGQQQQPTQSANTIFVEGPQAHVQAIAHAVSALLEPVLQARIDSLLVNTDHRIKVFIESAAFKEQRTEFASELSAKLDAFVAQQKAETKALVEACVQQATTAMQQQVQSALVQVEKRILEGLHGHLSTEYAKMQQSMRDELESTKASLLEVLYDELKKRAGGQGQKGQSAAITPTVAPTVAPTVTADVAPAATLPTVAPTATANVAPAALLAASTPTVAPMVTANVAPAALLAASTPTVAPTVTANVAPAALLAASTPIITPTVAPTNTPTAPGMPPVVAASMANMWHDAAAAMAGDGGDEQARLQQEQGDYMRRLAVYEEQNKQYQLWQQMQMQQQQQPMPFQQPYGHMAQQSYHPQGYPSGYPPPQQQFCQTPTYHQPQSVAEGQGALSVLYSGSITPTDPGAGGHDSPKPRASAARVVTPAFVFSASFPGVGTGASVGMSSEQQAQVLLGLAACLPVMQHLPVEFFQEVVNKIRGDGKGSLGKCKSMSWGILANMLSAEESNSLQTRRNLSTRFPSKQIKDALETLPEPVQSVLNLGMAFFGLFDSKAIDNLKLLVEHVRGNLASRKKRQ